jgi:hypothetical protein
MPVLVDGSNLLHALGPEHSRRADVRRLVLERVRRERMRVVVVFDGPPPAGAPARESLGRVTIRYAAPASADDVIVSLLPSGAEARGWTVVTDDRGLAGRVRQRGAAVRSLAEWRRGLETPREPPSREGLTPSEVAEWEAYFSRREPPDKG